MVTADRPQGASWRADDLSGNGSAGDPGRWNSHGVPVVYCSSSLALFYPETLVHIGGDAGLLLQRWLASQRSLLAAVPSVIVPEESNLLINPRHPACALLLATTVRRWTYDSRLQ